MRRGSSDNLDLVQRNKFLLENKQRMWSKCLGQVSEWHTRKTLVPHHHHHDFILVSHYWRHLMPKPESLGPKWVWTWASFGQRDGWTRGMSQSPHVAVDIYLGSSKIFAAFVKRKSGRETIMNDFWMEQNWINNNNNIIHNSISMAPPL